MDRDLLEKSRGFLKDSVRKQTDFSQTDQNRGLDAPPVEKPYSSAALRFDLVKPGEWRDIPGVDLATAIGSRKGRRVYRPEPLTMEELSFLLWATQGMRGRAVGDSAFRTVPSAGCRHAFESYLAVLDVEGLDAAIYRYLPLSHQLLFEFPVEGLAEKLVQSVFGQAFTGKAALVFIWTAIPYRMEWRYGMASHKVIAIDAGHVCQNLYLACEAIGAGTCAIAAYDQEAVDRLVCVDGEDEFAVYLAPVGKV